MFRDIVFYACFDYFDVTFHRFISIKMELRRWKQLDFKNRAFYCEPSSGKLKAVASVQIFGDTVLENRVIKEHDRRLHNRCS